MEADTGLHSPQWHFPWWLEVSGATLAGTDTRRHTEGDYFTGAVQSFPRFLSSGTGLVLLDFNVIIFKGNSHGFSSLRL